MTAGKILQLNRSNFEETIKDSDKPVLVDFWAEWCGPCKMVAPVLDEIAQEMGDKVRVAKVNVDENQELANRFQVSSIPTFILFKDGRPADRMMGAAPRAAFEQLIERNS